MKYVLNLNSKIISKHIFLHIVMNVALFYTKNRSESTEGSTFLYHFIPSSMIVKAYLFFVVTFHKSF
jgi:hypothetical protein